VIDGINSILQRFSRLQEEITQIKNMSRDMVRPTATGGDESAASEAGEDFSETLARKIPGADDVDSLIGQYSSHKGIDEELIRAVIDVESGFDKNAVSDAGARGLMQLMPDTAAELGVNPDDPSENIAGGVQYLGMMIDRFDDLEEALAAYNAGPRAVRDYGGVPPFRETQNYVKQVMDKYRQLKKN